MAQTTLGNPNYGNYLRALAVEYQLTTLQETLETRAKQGVFFTELILDAHTAEILEKSGLDVTRGESPDVYRISWMKTVSKITPGEMAALKCSIKVNSVEEHFTRMGEEE